MKQSFTAKIDKISHDGRGIANIAGKTTFVFGGLPNETVVAQPLRHHRDYIEAEVVSIETPHAERVTPKCEHFDLCGGCSLQQASHALQIELKQAIVAEQFQHIAKIQPKQWLPPLISPSWGYRRKARLGVKFVAQKKQLILGFRERHHPRFLTPLQACHTLDPRVGLLLRPLQITLSQLTSYSVIPQIEVAMGDSNVALVVRHLAPLLESDLSILCQFAESHHLDLYLQPEGKTSIHKIYPPHSEAKLSYSLPEFDLTFWFHPTDFTQVNAVMNRAMVKEAITLLAPQPHEHILDLFCGLGNFTLPLARYSQHVTGIEGDQSMVERAQFNAEFNQIDSVQFYYANLMDANLLTPWLRNQYDKILLDPPRSGALEIIRHFPKLQAKRIVYVSCNPATLARDTVALLHQGYQLETVGLIDMFPHTSHIETIALFTH